MVKSYVKGDNLKQVSRHYGIPYLKLYYLVNTRHWDLQSAIDKLEDVKLAKGDYDGQDRPLVQQLAKKYHLSNTDVYNALNSLKTDVVKEEGEGSFLGLPLTRWVNNDTELKVINNMLFCGFSMEDTLDVTGIRLCLKEI